MLRRRLWLIVLVVVLTACAAGLASSRQQRLYQATAEVYLNPTAQLTGGAGTSAADAQERYLQTAAALAHTAGVASAALPLAHVPGASAASLLAHSHVTANASSNILTFRVTDAAPQSAVALVNADARAFQASNARLGTANLTTAISGLDKRIASLNTQITAQKAGGGHPAGLRAELASLSKERERLTQLKLIEPTAARISSTAAGAAQIQPQTTRNIVLGVLLGLTLAVALAVLAETLDSHVRSPDEVVRRLGLTLLARVADPAAGSDDIHPLPMLSDPGAPTAERYRKLRLSVDFANLAHDARSLLVTSALPGEGKSTTVANLAVAFARTGRRVVLADLDLRKPAVAQFFDLGDGPGVSDLVLGTATLEQALHAVPTGHDAREQGAAQAGLLAPPGNLYVLTAGTRTPHPGELIESKRLQQLMGFLEKHFDLVLIDTPPALPVGDAIALSRVTGGMIVVAHAGNAKRPTMTELRRLLEQTATPKLGVVLTGTEIEEDSYGYDYSREGGARDA